jgi:hypothetical protein
MTFLAAGCIETDAPPAAAADDDAVPDLGPVGPTGAWVNLENATQDVTLLKRLANATGTYYSIGSSTFEPTIGATSTGGLFMTHFRGTGAGTAIRRSLDHGQTWDDATPTLPTGTKVVPNSNDPYLYVDPWTDRVYDFDMCIILQGFCVAYSDDDGDSWTIYSVATGESVALDHQSLASSPHREGPEPVGYPNVLSFCVNRGLSTGGAWCSTSYDAGLSWTPLVPGYPVGTAQCSGLHGHLTTAVSTVETRVATGRPCTGATTAASTGRSTRSRRKRASRGTRSPPPRTRPATCTPSGSVMTGFRTWLGARTRPRRGARRRWSAPRA